MSYVQVEQQRAAVEKFFGNCRGFRPTKPTAGNVYSFQACCTAHDDRDPSLSIDVSENGRILVHCFAGCTDLAILAGVNASWKDFPQPKAEPRIVETYDYADASGKLLYQNVRFDPKGFRIRRADGNGGFIWGRGDVHPTLYNLPAMLNSDGPVLFVEGERDCQAAAKLGFVATTSGGAKSWKPQFAEYFIGRTVVIIPDADAPGREFAYKVAASLCGKASSLKVVELPNAKDLNEWAASGGTEDDLKGLIAIYKEFGQKASLPFRTARQIAEETPEQIEWIAKPYVAKGAITEISGKVKLAGKTTFGTNLSNRVLDGALFLGEPTTKTPIVYLTEQPPSSWRITLERAGLLGREDFHTLYFKDARGTAWSDVADGAAEHCLKVGAGMLIIDTLGQWAGITGDSENNAGDALAAMLPLQEAAGNGIAVIVLRHDRKSGGLVGESGRGSSAFSGAADIVMSIRRPEGNTKKTLRVIHAIGRYEVPEELVIDLTKDGYVALGTTANVAEAEAEQALLSALPRTETEAMTVKELIERAEVGRTTAQRVFKSLCARRGVEAIGAGKRGDPLRYFLPQNEFLDVTQ
jgi:AAA domain/Toprim-like